MALKKFWAAAACLPALLAQDNILSIEAPPALAAKRGATAQAKLKVSLKPGFHVNSNTPSEDYLIPLKLTWPPGPLESASVAYPKPQNEKYEFSDKPLSVFTGNFELITTFKVPPNAPVGPAVMSGKLRYQACNYKACFPPKTQEVKLTVQVQ
jgi:hypothetical protein